MLGRIQTYLVFAPLSPSHSQPNSRHICSLPWSSPQQRSITISKKISRHRLIQAERWQRCWPAGGGEGDTGRGSKGGWGMRWPLCNHRGGQKRGRERRASGPSRAVLWTHGRQWSSVDWERAAAVVASCKREMGRAGGGLAEAGEELGRRGPRVGGEGSVAARGLATVRRSRGWWRWHNHHESTYFSVRHR
jgi:hypothetical protein